MTYKNKNKFSILKILSILVGISKTLINSLGIIVISYFSIKYFDPKVDYRCLEGINTSFDNLWWIHCEHAFTKIFLGMQILFDPLTEPSYQLPVIIHNTLNWLITIFTWWIQLCYEILSALFGTDFSVHQSETINNYCILFLFIYILTIHLKIYKLKLNPKENKFDIKLWLVILALFYIMFFFSIGYLFSFILLLNFKIMVIYISLCTVFIIFNHYSLREK